MNLRLRHIQRRIAPVAWLLLVLLVVGPATPHLVQGAAAVLCIGADGHVEIERSHDRLLGTASPVGGPSDSAVFSSEVGAGHGDCVDVPLVAPDTDHCLSAAPAPNLDADASFAPVALAVPAAVESASFFSRGSPTQAPGFSSVLPAHSTNVLLL